MPLELRLILVLLTGRTLLIGQSVQVRTDELPWAIRNVPYHADIVTSVNGRCPLGDVAMSIASGKLPKGLELFNFGIQGTPRQIGQFRFTVRVFNACAVGTKTFALEVTGKPIVSISPRHIEITCRAGARCPDELLLVEATWPGLPYSIDLSSAPWLRIEPAQGRTPDPESALTGDRVRLGVDAAKLAPGVYHADIRFLAPGAENVAAAEVTLKLLNAP